MAAVLNHHKETELAYSAFIALSMDENRCLRSTVKGD